MAQFKFIDTTKRTYPHIVTTTGVLVAEAGMTYELDFQPSDGRWEAVVTTTKAPKTAPEADSQPEVTEEAPTPNEEQ